MVDLKPCPFCGGEKLEFYYGDIEGWIAHVRCIDCDDMIGPMSEYKYPDKSEAAEDAAAKWNRRAEPGIAELEARNIEHEMRFEAEEAKSEHWRTEYLNAASDAQQFACRVAALEAQLAERVKVERAAKALLNNLWGQVVSGAMTHVENWVAMERRHPGSRDLAETLSALEATPPAVSDEWFNPSNAVFKKTVASTPPAPKVTEEAELWTGEGDGFKSFTLSAKVAERWRKGSLKVTPYAALSGDAS